MHRYGWPALDDICWATCFFVARALTRGAGNGTGILQCLAGRHTRVHMHARCPSCRLSCILSAAKFPILWLLNGCIESVS